MDMFVANSGVWKKVTSMYVASSGTWKKVTAGYVASSGVWKKFFSSVLSAPVNTVAPVVSPSSGPAGSTTFSTTNGTWSPDDADGIYAYQWQFYDSGSLYGSISGATSSTYTPPSNYVSVYGSVLRCRVTATNATGSTSATSNEVTVTTPVPTGGSVTISPSGTQLAGTTLTVSTSGWSNSPTSYNVRLYASTSNPPVPGAIGTVLKASTSSSSLTYTITTSDATAPAYYFKAFAIATNAGGDSTEVESNVVLSALPSAPSGGSVTLSPSGTQYAGTTLTASTSGWSGSPTSYSLRLYASTSNPPSAGGIGSVLVSSTSSSSLTYTITTSDANPPSYYFKAYATATNAGGTSSEVGSNVVTSAPLPTPPSGGSVTLSGTGVAGTTLTATTSGWSGSPTSYSLAIYASTSNPPTTSSVLKAITSGSSLTYDVTTSDASPPAYYFRAFATATNAAGTSSQVASGVILSSLPAVSPPATPTGVTNTWNGGTSYTFSWSASSGATGYYINYGENTTAPSPNPPASIVGNVRSNVVFTSSTSYSFTSLSSSNYVGFQVAATNSGGTSSYSAPTLYK